ncbi:MAG: 50S ribosomal protein L6 [Anaerofustis stercorihominis]|nr:50S ribosomal protein L6 [Anaerofustis stercorihominis]
MSRIGRMPVNVPAGVEVTVDNGLATVKGPKGELTQAISKDMTVAIDNGVLTVTRPTDSKEHKSLHGLTTKLLSNMVIGVSAGFAKELQVVGVGYRVQKNGKTLVLNVGYSHPVEMDDPEGIETVVEGTNKIIVKGIDKAVVGQYAANIRKVRQPEPYKGKGIRYADEVIKLKEGKSGKK